MLTPEEKLVIRKRVKAWSQERRRRNTAQHRAADEWRRAAWEARMAGIPLETIARDSDVDRSYVSRHVTRWAKRHDLEVPTGARHASTLARQEQDA